MVLTLPKSTPCHACLNNEDATYPLCRKRPSQQADDSILQVQKLTYLFIHVQLGDARSRRGDAFLLQNQSRLAW